MEPQEYEVIPFDAERNDLKTHRTWGSWSIEGQFLITWTKDGLKVATRIPNVVAGFRSELVERLEVPTIRKVAPNYAESAE
jgi:hypothetical protein